MADDALSGFEPGPLIIILIIMGMIILYAALASPAEREKLIGVIPYERDAINAVPGAIEPIAEATYTLPHKLDIVEANFAPLAVIQTLSGQITVKHSAIQNRDATFTINVSTTNLASANLNFSVTAIEGNKELMVELNKIVVFSGALPKGPAAIPLPIAQLKQGTNTIRISAASPGANLLSSAAYSLQNVNFVGQQYVPEKASTVQVFTLITQEQQGLASAELTAFVRELSPATLSLSLNDKQIYSASLFADATIDMELPVSLLDASNTLNWTASKGGDYQILFGQVKTSYTKTPLNIKSYTFFVTDLESKMSKTGQINCNLTIVGDAVTQPITVQVNSYKLDLELTDGYLSTDICSYVQPGENFLSVKSSTSINLTQLRLLMSGRSPGV